MTLRSIGRFGSLLLSGFLCVSLPTTARSETIVLHGTGSWFYLTELAYSGWQSMTGLELTGGYSITAYIDTASRTPYESYFGGGAPNSVLPDQWGATVHGYRYDASYEITLHGTHYITGESLDVGLASNMDQWLALTDEHGNAWDVAGTYSGVGLPMCNGMPICSWLMPPALIESYLGAEGYYFTGQLPARVPEPGSLALLGFGLAGLRLSLRRKAN